MDDCKQNLQCIIEQPNPTAFSVIVRQEMNPDKTCSEEEPNSSKQEISSDPVLKPENLATGAVEKLKPLSGAAKKRFKWLRSRGYSSDEARALAAKPIKDSPVGRVKRTTFESIFSKGVGIKNAKTELTAYSIDKQKIKVGILPIKFPETSLKSFQVKSIQNAITERIISKSQGVSPTFFGAYPRAGWLLVYCGDRATVGWLKEEVPKLTPWNGAELCVVEETKLPRAQNLIGYFPESATDSEEIILKYIMTQNRDLNVEDWIVLRRINEGSQAILTLSVDNRSMAVLQKKGYKIYFKLVQVALDNVSRPKIRSRVDSKTDKCSKNERVETTSSNTVPGYKWEPRHQDQTRRRNMSTVSGRIESTSSSSGYSGSSNWIPYRRPQNVHHEVSTGSNIMSGWWETPTSSSNNFNWILYQRPQNVRPEQNQSGPQSGDFDIQPVEGCSYNF